MDSDTVHPTVYDSRRQWKQRRLRMNERRVKCAACGHIHYDLWCPMCKSVVNVKY